MAGIGLRLLPETHQDAYFQFYEPVFAAAFTSNAAASAKDAVQPQFASYNQQAYGKHICWMLARTYYVFVRTYFLIVSETHFILFDFRNFMIVS